MCAIAGFLSAEQANLGHLVTDLLRTLAHRGPDDRGWAVFRGAEILTGRSLTDHPETGELLLAHCRLSILDLSPAGWQPMASPDRRYWIVFNGEIYNYLELREDLKQEGVIFSSQSDTEVLLHAFIRWGAECLRRLVGMFAFAVYDVQRRRLFIARDFFGIKPLYYASTEQTFSFASEIKALLRCPGVSRRVDAEQLYAYLCYAQTDRGTHTFFQDVRRLPPGHFVEVQLDQPNRVDAVQYWSPICGEEATPLSFDKAAHVVREGFLHSVKLHMRSDVTVGATLSGGIDSSAVVAGVRHVFGRDLPLPTFSYVASGAEFNEEKWIDQVAGASNCAPTKVVIAANEIRRDIERFVWMQDEPVSSSSMYAQYRVFESAHRAGIKVMLDGQGADELLGGYRQFLSARLISLLRERRFVAAGHFARHCSRLPNTSIPRMLGHAVGSLLPAQMSRCLRRIAGADSEPPWINSQWFKERRVNPEVPKTIATRQELKLRLWQSLTDDTIPRLLRFQDRNSMAFSIESRVPFLTPQFVNLIYSLPEPFIISPEGVTKHVFRAAMRGLVPGPILDRRDKVGFNTDEVNWLIQLKPWIVGLLRSDAAKQITAIRASILERQFNELLARRPKYDWSGWRWMNLIEWSRQFEVVYD